MFHIFRKLSTDFGDRCGEIVYVETWQHKADAERTAEYMRGFYERHGLAVSHIILVQRGFTLQPI
jgi:hypothetical protein